MKKHKTVHITVNKIKVIQCKNENTADLEKWFKHARTTGFM